MNYEEEIRNNCAKIWVRGNEEETLEKIGEDVGVNRERVRQIQIESMRMRSEIILAEGLLAEHLD